MALTRNTYQRNTSWSAPYTFSGKEKDAETGYGYFGSRYYDSGLSIWLSVDPMSDKYPSMSPYNYCANNPVILVDPDGREITVKETIGDDGKTLYTITFTGKIVNEANNYSPDELQAIADDLAKSFMETFTGKGESSNWVAEANISVASEDNPLTEKDHAIRLRIPGDIPGASGTDIVGRAPFGENVIYLTDNQIGFLPATEGPYANSGFHDSGMPTIGRTFCHEFAHSAYIYHNEKPIIGNLMNVNRNLPPIYFGKGVTEDQIIQINANANEKGLINNGQQY